MKGTVFALLLASIVYKNHASLVTCPPIVDSNILLPHQFECSTFFLCDNSSSKPSFLLRCPTGLYFNSRNQSNGCVLADQAKCEPQVQVRQVDRARSGSTLPSIDSPESYRNYTMHLPNPAQCNQFFRYEGHNEPQLYECPDDLQFDPVLEICDLAEEVNCRSEDCQEIPEPQCPPRNEQLVHLPHPTDCGSFYKCDWGNPILFHCPEGLYFNPDINVCDWPRNVECNRCESNSGVGEAVPINVSEYQRPRHGY